MSGMVVNALTRAISFTAGVITGLIGGLLHRERDDLLPLLQADDAFPDLRLAILGRHRRQIATVLGVPPTASMGFGVRTRGGTRPTFWQATTWYYPIDQRQRRAIAIRFVGDRAREVECIGIDPPAGAAEPQA